MRCLLPYVYALSSFFLQLSSMSFRGIVSYGIPAVTMWSSCATCDYQGESYIKRHRRCSILCAIKSRGLVFCTKTPTDRFSSNTVVLMELNRNKICRRGQQHITLQRYYLVPWFLLIHMRYDSPVPNVVTNNLPFFVTN